MPTLHTGDVVSGAMMDVRGGPVRHMGIGAVIVITTTVIALIGTTKIALVSCLRRPNQCLRLTGIASAHGTLSLRTLAPAEQTV